MKNYSCLTSNSMKYLGIVDVYSVKNILLNPNGRIEVRRERMRERGRETFSCLVQQDDFPHFNGK